MKHIVGVLLFLFAACLGWSQERIERFDAAVTVDKQGTAWVEETISAVGPLEQGQPLHRDLPAQAQDITLTKNGEPCTFTLQPYADRVRVQFEPSLEAASPRDVYQLQYHIPQAVTFAPERDELDWNVTGRGFFVINKAVFKLRLPQRAAVSKAEVAGYIGAPNNWIEAAGEEAPQVAVDEEAGEISLETMAPISLGRGLRVVALWRPGVVDVPENVKWSRWKYRYGNWLVPLEVALLVLVLGLFYYLSWRRVGRRPLAKPVQWRQTPPEGFSAASLRYVISRGEVPMWIYTVSLAVKGAVDVTLEQVNHLPYAVLRLKDKEVAFLSADERMMCDSLFSNGRTEFVLGRDNPFRWRGVQAAVHKQLKQQGVNRLFNRHLAYNGATLLAGVLLVIIGCQCGECLAAVLTVLFGGICWLICGYWWAAADRYRTAKRIAIGLFALAIAGFLGCMMQQSNGVRWWLPAAGLVSFFGGVFSYWIASYTPSGQAVMNQAEGFKCYLRQIGADRNVWSDGQQAAQVFCDYLPYACALDVSEEWIDAFSLRVDKSVLEQTLHQRGLQVPLEKLRELLGRLNRSPKPTSSEQDFLQDPFYNKSFRP